MKIVYDDSDDHRNIDYCGINIECSYDYDKYDWKCYFITNEFNQIEELTFDYVPYGDFVLEDFKTAFQKFLTNTKKYILIERIFENKILLII